MTDTSFNIGHIEEGCEIYGPGKRTVVWFQGCTLGCDGCWNRRFQPVEPRQIVEREELFDFIVSSGAPVTFLGGEPLLQAENLAWLMGRLKGARVHTMLYTGYELFEIEANPLFIEICGMADILIPGRYVKEKRDTGLIWRGSSNQPLIIQAERPEIDESNQVEIIIDDTGAVTCLGYPSENMRSFLESLDRR